ncbi:MAG: hypothetical protein GX757_08815 [Clostridiales bacterium]|nr:hypothetical protein [Clostridiales bacterium]
MGKFRIRIKFKLYQLILTGIIIFSIYLLLKYVSISLSDNIGQAGMLDLAFSHIGSGIFAKGSSLISYTAKEKDGHTAFFDGIFDDRLALGKFLNTNEYEAVSAFASDYKSYYGNYSDEPELAELNADSDTKGSGFRIRFNDIAARQLGLEYILTNGSVIKSEVTGRLIWDGNMPLEQLNIGYLKGEISPVPEDVYSNEEAHMVEAASGARVEYTLEQLRDMNFLIRNFYLVDGTTVADSSLFDGEKLASADMTLKQTNDSPQILIFHTHSQEAFRDSRPGVEEDTVVGMGALLAKTLTEKYNYNVIHDKTYYDVLKGYNKSYSQAEIGLKKMLDEYPSIEVIIDIHRNSGKEKLVYINGKQTAQIMMFNGLCRDHDGPMTNLENPYLQDNLAFSLQLQLKSFDIYPGLFSKNYLKAYRYNMHLRPKSLLVELGSVNNTVEAARNAIVLFADVLDAVLKGDKAGEELIENKVHE